MCDDVLSRGSEATGVTRDSHPTPAFSARLEKQENARSLIALLRTCDAKTLKQKKKQKKKKETKKKDKQKKKKKDCVTVLGITIAVKFGTRTIKVKELLDLYPDVRFDSSGQCDQTKPLLYALCSWEYAVRLDKLREDEAVRLLKTGVTGPARGLIRNIEGWKDIVSILLNRHASKRTLEEVYFELQYARQGGHEKTVDFWSRVRTLGAMLFVSPSEIARRLDEGIDWARHASHPDIAKVRKMLGSATRKRDLGDAFSKLAELCGCSGQLARAEGRCENKRQNGDTKEDEQLLVSTPKAPAKLKKELVCVPFLWFVQAKIPGAGPLRFLMASGSNCCVMPSRIARPIASRQGREITPSGEKLTLPSGGPKTLVSILEVDLYLGAKLVTFPFAVVDSDTCKDVIISMGWICSQGQVAMMADRGGWATSTLSIFGQHLRYDTSLEAWIFP